MKCDLSKLILQINSSEESLIGIAEDSFHSSMLSIFINRKTARVTDSTMIEGLNGIELQHDLDWKLERYRPKYILSGNVVRYFDNSALIIGRTEILNYLHSHKIWKESKPSPEIFLEIIENSLELLRYY